jgi:hypothetical protein
MKKINKVKGFKQTVEGTAWFLLITYNKMNTEEED